MTKTNSCVEKDALIDHLYGEADADARTRVDAHLRSCAQCADEIRELKDVRGTLEAWDPPKTELGFRVVTDADSVRAPVSLWGRLRRPAWGFAAAAVLVLAAGLAITKPALEIEQGEMVLRVAWRDTTPAAQPAQYEVAPVPRARSASGQPLGGTPVGAPAGIVTEDELLLRVRQLEEELRKADLSELARVFGEFEGSGAERARQQLLDSLQSVSAR